MAALTIDTLKEICERVPGEYTIRFVTSKGEIKYLTDKIEVDITNSNLILKE